jgi:hypothetical protein
VSTILELLRNIFKIAVTSWFDDTNDTELLNLIPYLETLSKVDNIYTHLLKNNEKLLPNSISTIIDDTKTFYSTYDNKQKIRPEASITNTNHLKTQRAIKKPTTLIKRTYNISDISDVDLTANDNTDLNNNTTKTLNENINTDDSTTLSENSVVLNMDVTSNKFRLSRQQRDVLIEE